MCLSKRCPKCGGDLFQEEEDGIIIFECLQCGHTEEANQLEVKDGRSNVATRNVA